MAMGTLECVSLNICYGNRVPVVVGAWESYVHGEVEQLISSKNRKDGV